MSGGEQRRGLRGFSLLEVLVSIAVFLAGVVAIVFMFPRTLQAAHEAELKTKAALLAQMKAEEVRRDDDTSQTLTLAIAALRRPTDPLINPQEPDLSYSFNGRSLMYAPTETPDGDPNIARVVIWRNAAGLAPTLSPSTPAGEYDPTNGTEFRRVVYELRFGP